MITVIFTGSGIFAIIIGLAATEAFGNLISGAMILIFKPFKIGDLVKVNTTVSGVVHEITLRHTVIKTLENTDVVIPNSEMNKLTLENISAATLKGNFLVVEVSYESNLEKAIQIITETIMAHPNFIDGRSESDKQNNVPAVTVSCTSFNASGIELKAKVFSESHAIGFAMLSDIRLTLKKRFDEEGIEIPYPHVTITQKS